MAICSKSYKGNLFPNFDIWVKDMMGDGQTVDSGDGDSLHDGEGANNGHARVQAQAQGAGVHAQLWGRRKEVRQGGGRRAREDLSSMQCHIISHDVMIFRLSKSDG